jgi:hypothetical protein
MDNHPRIYHLLKLSRKKSNIQKLSENRISLTDMCAFKFENDFKQKKEGCIRINNFIFSIYFSIILYLELNRLHLKVGD